MAGALQVAAVALLAVQTLQGLQARHARRGSRRPTEGRTDCMMAPHGWRAHGWRAWLHRMLQAGARVKTTVQLYPLQLYMYM